MLTYFCLTAVTIRDMLVSHMVTPYHIIKEQTKMQKETGGGTTKARVLCGIALFLLSCASYAGYKIGVMVGRSQEQTAAVAAKAAYHHPVTGKITYGVQTAAALAVEFCLLEASGDKNKIQECHK